MAEHSSPTPKLIRQSLLNDLDERKKVVTELSDEELEEVAGGVGGENRFQLGMASAYIGVLSGGVAVSILHDEHKEASSQSNSFHMPGVPLPPPQ